MHLKYNTSDSKFYNTNMLGGRGDLKIQGSNHQHYRIADPPPPLSLSLSLSPSLFLPPLPPPHNVRFFFLKSRITELYGGGGFNSSPVCWDGQSRTPPPFVFADWDVVL